MNYPKASIYIAGMEDAYIITFTVEVAPMPGNPAYEPTFTSAEMSRQAPQLEKISETELCK